MIIVIKVDIRMFLEWESTVGNCKSTAGNFKITLLTRQTNLT